MYSYKLDAQVLKVFRYGRKIVNKCRPLLVQLEMQIEKPRVLIGKFFLLKTIEPYTGIYVSSDVTKAKYKQLVDELKLRWRRVNQTLLFMVEELSQNTKSELNLTYDMETSPCGSQQKQIILE